MKTKKTLQHLILTLGIFLAIVLVPGKALAADYDVWVGGTRITDLNKSNVLGDGTVSFDPTTNTLTLDNATVNGALTPYGRGETAAIYTEVNLTVEMVGDSTLIGKDSTEYSWGIACPMGKGGPQNSLTFTGEGTLAVTAGKGVSSIGIGGRGITIESGTLTVTAGERTPNGGSTGGSTDGILCMQAPLTLKSGTLIATGGKGWSSMGIYVEGTTFKMEGGTLIATGGEASSDAYSAGIGLSGSNFIMTGGTLEAVGGTGGTINVGLYGYWESTAAITGGDLTLRGTTRGTTIPLNIDDYPNPIVTVDDNVEGTSPGTWNTTTPLNDGSFIFVKIKPIHVTVSFDPNGGLGTMTPVSLINGAPYTLPANGFTAFDSGYFFAGWKLGEESKQPGETITVTDNITLVAQWRRIPAIVTFDANGGLGTMEDIGTFVGQEVTLPANGFTAADASYFFTGWKVGNDIKQPGDEITVTGNLTVEAQWKRTPATLSFDPNGGIGTMEDMDTFVGLKVTLPENGFTPKDGRVFDSWLVGSEEKQPGDEITVTGDTVVKAQWALTGVGYVVNLNVTKDNASWSEDAPVITIGTTPETAVENGEQLPNGTYTVYEDGIDTGRTVTVSNGVSPRELNLKYYTLTVIGGTGIASTEGSGSYLVGQEVTISATVESGYLWTGWKSSNSILMRSSNLRVYTFNMPAGTLTMTGTARRR